MKKQVRNGLLIAVFTASLGFYSCGDKVVKNEDKVMNHDMDHEMDHDMKTDSVNEVNKEEVIDVQFKETTTAAVFENYINVKNALVASNSEDAQKHAKLLQESLIEAKAEQSLVDATKQLEEATDINKQREAFSKVTKGMEVILDGTIASGQVYKQFCPMAFEGKGDYWYTNNEEIRNPYFGEMMLKCGRVEEILSNK
ncbi:MAG TPA: DUF3347 domain-containing protein [Gillisia sp.]|nr:DUF3347 domain-containing protein [Gillisia sp.]